MNTKFRRLIILASLALVSLGCNFVTVIEPTATPEPPTPTFTSTPEPKPTATPTATQQVYEIPADWKLFSSERVEVWLPGDYIGGNLEEDLPVVLAELRSLGGDYEGMADQIEQNPDLYEMIVYAPMAGGGGFLTNFTLARTDTLPSIPLETLMSVLESSFSEEFTVLESTIVDLGNYQAGRIMLQMSVYGITSQSISYIISTGGDVWVLTYTAEVNDFTGLLDTFETSARSFRIIQ
jgi:hypothetical protein